MRQAASVGGLLLSAAASLCVAPKAKRFQGLKPDRQISARFSKLVFSVATRLRDSGVKTHEARANSNNGQQVKLRQ
jgi:hypothetical protein